MSVLSRRPFLAAFVLMAASSFVLGGLEAQPKDGGDVAAVFPPWISGTGAFERVAEAGGAVIRAGVVDTILVAHSDDSDFARRLHRAGAWLVLDPVAFGGCLAPVATSSQENEKG